MTNYTWPNYRGDKHHTGLSKRPGPTKPYLLFRFKTLNSIVSSPAIDSAGNLYFGTGTNGGKFFKISSNGTKIWTVQNQYDFVASPALSTDEDTVYIGDIGFNFYAFATATGSLKFGGSLGVAMTSSPYIRKTPRGDELYLAMSNGNINKIDTVTGFSAGSYQNAGIGAFLYSSPVIFKDMLYVGSTSSFLSAINISKSPNFGQYLGWSCLVLVGKAIRSSPAVDASDGTVYFGSDNFEFYAVSTNVEKFCPIKWSFATKSFVASSPVIAGDKVYFASDDGFVYALFKRNGTEVWKHDTRSAFDIASPAVSSNGILYIGDLSGYCHALNASTGVLIWKYFAGGSIKSGPVIGLNGTLYFGSSDNAMFAIKDSAIPPHTSSPAVAPPTDSSLSSGMIALIVVMSIFGACICCCGLLYYIYIRYFKKNENENVFKCGNIEIPRIPWSDVYVDEKADPATLVIGEGSFGTVILAKLKNRTIDVESLKETVPSADCDMSATKQSLYTTIRSKLHSDSQGNQFTEVVVKVITKSIKYENGDGLGRTTDSKSQQTFDMALMEVALVLEAESKMRVKDSIIKMYGIVKGIVPSRLCKAFQIPDDYSATGIVMRLEGGGSLQSLIYKQSLATEEKLRLLTELAKVIADMHSSGIIHGDLKPENVLLSLDQPPKIRLADFGLAALRKDILGSLQESTLQQTKYTRGTPYYCAPEMFPDPFSNELESGVAKASRKTDMYAFAIMAWEILAQKRPFTSITSEGILVARIYQGVRPDLNELPEDCPTSIKSLISRCWLKDRDMRKSAIDCYSVLLSAYNQFSNQPHDAFLSYESSCGALAKYILYRLTQMGDQVSILLPSLMIDESIKSSAAVSVSVEFGKAQDDHISDQEIFKSSVVIAILSQAFQNDSRCMDELRYARKCKPPKPIIPVFVDPNHKEWLNVDLIYLCQLKADSNSVVVFDFSKYNVGASEVAANSRLAVQSRSTETVRMSVGNSTPPCDDIAAGIAKVLSSSCEDSLDEYAAFSAADSDIDMLHRRLRKMLVDRLIIANRGNIQGAF